MMLSTSEVARARQTVSRVLDEMGLDAYLFEIEPGEDDWQLHLECAAEDGWSRLTVNLDADTLAQAAEDEGAFRRVMARCAEACGECKRAGGSGED